MGLQWNTSKQAWMIISNTGMGDSFTLPGEIPQYLQRNQSGNVGGYELTASTTEEAENWKAAKARKERELSEEKRRRAARRRRPPPTPSGVRGLVWMYR